MSAKNKVPEIWLFCASDTRTRILYVRKKWCVEKPWISAMYKSRIKMYKQKNWFLYPKNAFWYKNSINIACIYLYLDTVISDLQKTKIRENPRKSWLGQLDSNQ